MIEDLSSIFLQDSLKQLDLAVHKEGSHGILPTSELQDFLYHGHNNNLSKYPQLEQKQDISQSLEIWAKKIYYQSDDLQKSVQKNSEKYLERHEELERLIKEFRLDCYAWLESAKEQHRARENELMEKEGNFRRICNTISDTIKANECKIHKLESMVEQLSSIIVAQEAKFLTFEAKQLENLKPLHLTMNQILNIISQRQTDQHQKDHYPVNPPSEKQNIENKDSISSFVKTNTRKRILLTSDELKDLGKALNEYKEDKKQVIPIRKNNNRTHLKRRFFILQILSEHSTTQEENGRNSVTGSLSQELGHLRILRATLESLRKITEKISCDIQTTCENYQDIIELNKRWERIADDTTE
ncbi:hypothetical protein T552_01243 [Pneumocystis carinii B80]|uniref:Uncharacterized protein n=1 Tax=Pneumocystis carinii (strain B80) TaxID=1408658 RepID=A0A0W4ZLM9_PNEC8|nr:hypothetical protein T552_01243 [Pneumocystis carinii B80]KTW29288.1 hypothetical protein T552_01243 [Pneumocystis carinii B80]